MWLCTTFGFYSAVQHRDDPSLLMVRARASDDIVAIVLRLPASLGTIRIWSTPLADYPYRIVIKRKVFASFVRRTVIDELAYDNFKSAVPDAKHEAAYHRVWDVLHDLEEGRPTALHQRAVLFFDVQPLGA